MIAAFTREGPSNSPEEMGLNPNYVDFTIHLLTPKRNLAFNLFFSVNFLKGPGVNSGSGSSQIHFLSVSESGPFKVDFTRDGLDLDIVQVLVLLGK